jgi:hypothetical protein
MAQYQGRGPPLLLVRTIARLRLSVVKAIERVGLSRLGIGQAYQLATPGHLTHHVLPV